MFAGGVTGWADWEYSVFDSNGGNAFNSIAVDAQGNPFIGYMNIDKVKCAVVNGSTWTVSAFDQGGSSNNAYSVSSAIGRDGRPRMLYSAWVNTNQREIHYAEWDGSSWAITKLSTSLTCKEAVSLALDANDNPHVVYIDSSAVQYAVRSGGVWQIKQNIPNIYCRRLTLKLNSHGTPCLLYSSGFSSYSEYGDVRYAEFSGAAWTVRIIEAYRYCKHSVMTLDQLDKAHIVYVSGNTLAYACLNGNDLSGSAVDTGNVSDCFPAITTDSADKVYVCYAVNWPTNYGLVLAQKVQTVWKKKYIDTRYCIGAYSSMVFDAAGALHVAYGVRSDKGDPNYAVNKGYAAAVSEPFLSWVGDKNYENDGLAREQGYSSTQFVFRVKYTNPYNTPVQQGMPKVHLYAGNSEISGSPVTMQEEDSGDTTYSDGKVYSCSMTLPSGSYSYSFEAVDQDGISAVGVPCGQNVGLVVTAMQSLPAAGEVKVVGPAGSRGIINPDKGDRVQIFFQGSEQGAFTCRVFDVEGNLLFEEQQDHVSGGYFDWVPQDISSGIYLVHVEGPGIKTKRKLAVVR